MTTLKLDKDNNLVVGSEMLTLEGNDALIQDIRNRLGMFLGEYPFDITLGVDYIGLFSANNQKEIQNAIIQEIKKDNRVSEAYIEDLKNENGRLTIGLKVISQSGDTLNV